MDARAQANCLSQMQVEKEEGKLAKQAHNYHDISNIAARSVIRNVQYAANAQSLEQVRKPASSTTNFLG
jgi:hypothetical protein